MFRSSQLRASLRHGQTVHFSHTTKDESSCIRRSESWTSRWRGQNPAVCSIFLVYSRPEWISELRIRPVLKKKKIKHGVRAGSDTTEKLQTFYESPKTEICCEIPQMSVDMVHPMPSHATRARCNSTCLNDIGRRHPCIYAGEESLKAPGLWVYRLLGQGEVNHTSRTMAAIEELGNPRFSYAASRGFLDKTCLQLVLWNILITSSHICCIIFFFIR